MKFRMMIGLIGIQLTALYSFSAAMYSVIPKPVDLQPREGVFEITPGTAIVVEPSVQRLGDFLADMLSPAMGYRLTVAQHVENDEPRILLILDDSMKEAGAEGYHLSVEKDNVIIRAMSQQGLFYGMMTLRQLLPAEIFREAKMKGVQWTVPCVKITDRPRFQWRGMHLDVCRHFMPKEFVKKYIDLIAQHKMNVFHWHLTEDQGWRIEIKKYPKLTEAGAWREETITGRGNTLPREFDGKPHGGFYTQDDVREIVQYAKERFVTVVPEIEMPGHSQAAIAAYPELGNYDRQLGVCRWWGYGEDVFNVEESTIVFLQDVLTEVLGLFPSEYIHIGGDEVPKGHWKNSERAQKRMKELGLKNEEELQSWFIKQMDTFLTNAGRRLVGWDEILEGGLAPGATVMSWRGVDGGIAAAKAGHDVVMAPGSHTYFDHYQAGPKGEPLAFGGFTPLEKVYSYEPIPETLNDDEAKHVLGAQAQIWTEFILDAKHVEYMVLPRMCAMAEVVWTPREEKDYDDFYARLVEHAKRLTIQDVNFHPLKKHQERTE